MKLYDFHYEPTILLAKAAESITNGFTSVFKELKRRTTCCAHVIIKINLRLKSVNKDHSQSIRNDIVTLQAACYNKLQFDKARELFFNKWRSENDSTVYDFLQYLDDQWLKERTIG